MELRSSSDAWVVYAQPPRLSPVFPKLGSPSQGAPRRVSDILVFVSACDFP